ncbi:hypothetical protein M3Y99_01390400 [Aphelenchoides fujianensis]|nr:hypothetical protein M3Y99_01390400 [Aphelenchoides fujianensis]
MHTFLEHPERTVRKFLHKLLVRLRRQLHTHPHALKMTSYYEHGQQTAQNGLHINENGEFVTADGEIFTGAHDGQQNGGEGGVDAHFAAFRWAYDKANESWYVQKAKETYDATKKSFGPLERTLDGLESRVADASQHAAPIYEQYVYPHTDRVVNLCKGGLDTSKTVATTGGIMGLNLAVVGTQLSLIASAAVTSLLLDGMILTKNLGSATVNKVVDIEHSIRDGIWATIEKSRNLANIRGEKINEHANGFLDIANAVVDNYFHLPLDEEGELPADANVKDRVSRLARRLATLLQTKTHDNILEPAQRQLHGLADQLRKSLALVDVLRERKDRLNESVNGLWNRVEPGQLSESVSEMWAKVETEAREAKLDKNLANAKTVYEVKDEVLEEAKSKLQDVSSWANNFRVNGDASEEKKNE